MPSGESICGGCKGVSKVDDTLDILVAERGGTKFGIDNTQKIFELPVFIRRVPVRGVIATWRISQYHQLSPFDNKSVAKAEVALLSNCTTRT